MNRAIIFLGLVTIMTALVSVASAQATTVAYVAVWYTDASGDDTVCAGTAYCEHGADSCEVVLEAGCAMTLEACLGASFFAGDSEESDDVLGCSPDAKRADIDYSALLAMLPSCEPGDNLRGCQ